MLKILIPSNEFFDEENQMFITTDEVVLELEHSLVSLSKWESIWKKPFIDGGDKTAEETLSYIKFMTLTPNVPEDVYTRMTEDNLKAIRDYIEDPMTATWFNENGPQKSSSKKLTNELIYYWMSVANIPMECQYWHLNRLFTQIRVYSAENAPAKKMSRTEMAEQRRALNAKRRAQMGSSG